MKKILLLAIFAIGIVFASNAKEVYCELVGSCIITGTKVRVSVDFGENTAFKAANNQLVDEQGKAIKFNTMVAALNYMGQFGWKFKAAYALSMGNQNVIHWLLAKEVENDEEIKEGILQHGDFKE